MGGDGVLEQIGQIADDPHGVGQGHVHAGQGEHQQGVPGDARLNHAVIIRSFQKHVQRDDRKKLKAAVGADPLGHRIGEQQLDCGRHHDHSDDAEDDKESLPLPSIKRGRSGERDRRGSDPPAPQENKHCHIQNGVKYSAEGKEVHHISRGSGEIEVDLQLSHIGSIPGGPGHAATHHGGGPERHGYQERIDARLESQTEADGRHEEGSGPTSTQTGHNGGHAEKQQTQKPACPPTGVEQMFRHFFQCPVFLGKAEEKCGHHKVKKQGHWKEGDHAAGGQTACCGAQQKGKAERDQANVDVQPGPQD